jgi:hypothetical protein
MRKISAMFNTSIESVYELSELFFKTAKNLSPDEILYWSRNSDAFKNLFEKKEIDFLPENRKIQRIPPIASPLPVKKIFGMNRPPFNHHLYPDDYCQIKPVYDATLEVEAFGCDLICSLTVDEIVKIVEDKYVLSEALFTPDQIRALAQEQNKKGMGGILNFEGINYFPFRELDDQIGLISIGWSDYNCHADVPKNRWKFWFNHGTYRTHQTGQVVLLREVS